MNKSELTAHLKQSDDTINKILEAAQLPLDQPDYGPEQVQVIEVIAQLVSSKQAKSFKEAGEIHRKPIREGQLNEVAGRHQLAPERIPEVLSALKLKPETLTDAQLEQFAEVCAKLQSGIELAAALPKAAGKGKKAAVTNSAPETDSTNGAIALVDVNGSGLTTRIPEQTEASLRDVAKAAVDAATDQDISERAAEIAVQVVDQVDGVIRQMIFEAIFDKDNGMQPDPDRAAAKVREIKANRRGQQ